MSLDSWLISGSIVIHIVLGLIPLDFLDNILNHSTLLNKRILFLGYKQFGRAKNTPLPDSIKDFEVLIKKKILENRSKHVGTFFVSSVILGFDNLAIEQLNLDKSLLKPEFSDIFMGPEFSCSMYIDAVEGEFAETSRSENRVSWNSTDILTYFNHDKNKE